MKKLHLLLLSLPLIIVCLWREAANIPALEKRKAKWVLALFYYSSEWRPLSYLRDFLLFTVACALSLRSAAIFCIFTARLVSKRCLCMAEEEDEREKEGAGMVVIEEGTGGTLTKSRLGVVAWPTYRQQGPYLAYHARTHADSIRHMYKCHMCTPCICICASHFHTHLCWVAQAFFPSSTLIFSSIFLAVP